MITDKTRETFVRLRTSLRRFEVKGNSADRAREKIAIERGEDVWTSSGKGRDTINWRGGLPREESIDHNSFLMRRLSTSLARTLFIRRVISFLATRQHSARVFFYPPVHVEGRRRVVLGRIEAHDDQILWSHPPIKASAHGDWAHPLFLVVYYCTSGHHEWIKTKRGSEVARARTLRTAGVIEETERKSPFHPPLSWNGQDTLAGKYSPSRYRRKRNYRWRDILSWCLSDPESLTRISDLSRWLIFQ